MPGSLGFSGKIATAAALMALLVACGQRVGAPIGQEVTEASVADAIESCAAVLGASGEERLAANARDVVGAYRALGGNDPAPPGSFPPDLTRNWVLFGCAVTMLELGKRPEAVQARAVATAYCEQGRGRGSAGSPMVAAAWSACDPWPATPPADVDQAVIGAVDACASAYAAHGQADRAAAMIAAAAKLRDAATARAEAEAAAQQGRESASNFYLGFAPDRVAADCAVALREFGQPAEAERAEQAAMTKCVEQVRVLTMQGLLLPGPAVSCPRRA